MHSIGAGDLEGTKQLDNTRMIMLAEILHDLSLIGIGFRDISAEDFQSVKLAIFTGLDEPDGREAAGSQLVKHSVLGDLVTNVDGMIAAWHVFLNIFVTRLIHV